MRGTGIEGSADFLNLAGPNAACTDMHAHMGTFGIHCSDRLQIRLGKLL